MKGTPMNTPIANDRVVTDPAVLLGKPVIRGTRIPVSLVINYLSHGHSVEELLNDYPNLTREDVEAATAYHTAELERVEVRSF
jgi:uncharacterized protein (DUF433 family)